MNTKIENKLHQIYTVFQENVYVRVCGNCFIVYTKRYHSERNYGYDHKETIIQVFESFPFSGKEEYWDKNTAGKLHLKINIQK